jgi:hypothetical protein
MGNVFNKTCYFLFEDTIFRGIILKNKGNKYVVKSEEKSRFGNEYWGDIAYIKKEEVKFYEVDFKDYIDNISNKYLMDVLTNNVDTIYYSLLVGRLFKFFPNNEIINKMRNSLFK